MTGFAEISSQVIQDVVGSRITAAGFALDGTFLRVMFGVELALVHIWSCMSCSRTKRSASESLIAKGARSTKLATNPKAELDRHPSFEHISRMLATCGSAGACVCGCAWPSVQAWNHVSVVCAKTHARLIIHGAEPR